MYPIDLFFDLALKYYETVTSWCIQRLESIQVALVSVTYYCPPETSAFQKGISVTLLPAIHFSVGCVVLSLISAELLSLKSVELLMPPS